MTHPTPVDVIEAALQATPIETAAQAGPAGTNPQRVQAHIVHAALVTHGFLPDGPDPQPHPVVTPQDAQRLAEWLAEASRFARYTGDGWRRLVQSETDVRVAVGKALASNPDARTEDRVRGVAARLVDYIRRGGQDG